jgi:hypothetical protein
MVSPVTGMVARMANVRGEVERRSAVLLVFLHRLPRWVPPVVAGVLLLAGLFASGVLGGAILLVLAAALGWLAYLSWPRVEPPLRLLRAAALAVLVAVAAGHILGQF